MSKKLYGLISTLVCAAGTVASALVGYFQPSNYGAIIAAIGIGVPAVNDILLLFVAPSENNK
jgi:hypothetical protein